MPPCCVHGKWSPNERMKACPVRCLKKRSDRNFDADCLTCDILDNVVQHMSEELQLQFPSSRCSANRVYSIEPTCCCDRRLCAQLHCLQIECPMPRVASKELQLQFPSSRCSTNRVYNLELTCCCSTMLRVWLQPAQIVNRCQRLL